MTLPRSAGARINAVRAILQDAAIKGERCPTADGIARLLEKRRPGGWIVPLLARRGEIKIEVSGKNWRVVEIMTGAHAGRRTAENPDGHKPYRVIDRNGDRYLDRDGRVVKIR